MSKRNSKIVFKDAPQFTPNLTPREIFQLGSFGGTYYRPIYSSVTKKNYKDVHKKYDILKGIPENKLTRKNYDKSINKYKVKVGTTLEFWESKKWITKYNPYGWLDWYVNFYMGKRTPDDERQINRWLKTVTRFKIWLINQIIEKGGTFDDESISPKIRQTLQHWGYQLTLKDFRSHNKRSKSRNKRSRNKRSRNKRSKSRNKRSRSRNKKSPTKKPLVGDKVEIAIKPYVGKTEIGIVKDVLTNRKEHSRGFKVRLENNIIGRVTKLIS